MRKRQSESESEYEDDKNEDEDEDQDEDDTGDEDEDEDDFLSDPNTALNSTGANDANGTVGDVDDGVIDDDDSPIVHHSRRARRRSIVNEEDEDGDADGNEDAPILSHSTLPNGTPSGGTFPSSSSNANLSHSNDFDDESIPILIDPCQTDHLVGSPPTPFIDYDDMPPLCY